MEMSSRRKLVGPDCVGGKRLICWSSWMFGLEGLTMTIDRASSSADPPQQLRERKNELILEPKDCGGGAVMSYMDRESVLSDEEFVRGSFFQQDRRIWRTTRFVLPGLVKILARARIAAVRLVLHQFNECHCVWSSNSLADETTTQLCETDTHTLIQASDKQVTSKQSGQAGCLSSKE
jgi:hypothetical protein